MKIVFFGGALEVGRSCLMIESGNKKILIDAGLKIGKKDELLPEFDLSKAKEVRAVIVSHAHLDHSAFLPLLVKSGFNGKIYCTKPTRDLMHLLLSDAARIAREEGRQIYGEKEIRNAMEKIVTVEYNRKFTAAKGIKAKFFNAGHILGSASILIEAEKKKMLYSSDFNDRETNLLDKAGIKEKHVDILFLESTYGSKKDLLPSLASSGKQLAQAVNETIKRKGKALIPVFAVGRAQEVMLVLENYMRSGFIQKAPVYLDGMLRKANKITRHNILFVRKEIPRRILVNDDDPFKSRLFRVAKTRSKKDVMNEESAVILASSGMLSGGASIEYFKLLAGDEKNSVIFVGYQAPETLGRRVLEGEKIAEIKGKKIEVKAEIRKVRFSGHADFNGLRNLAKKLKPKKAILMHGEKEKIIELKQALEKQKISVLTPKIKEEIIV